MAQYKGKTVSISRPAADIAEKFADLSRMQPMLEQLPAEEREKIGDVKFDRDSIAIVTPQIGEIRFEVTERSPRKVEMKAVGTPVPLTMSVDLDQKAPDLTDVTTAVDVEVPMMLRPLVAPHMQKAVDQFGQLIAKLAQ